MKGESAMPDITGGQDSVHARELWKQWSGTTARIWESLLGSTKASYIDPYGLYQTWFKAMSNFQEQMKASSASISQASEVWKQWVDTTTQLWSNAANMWGEAQASQQGLYQAWLSSLSALQEQAYSNFGSLSNPQEAWRRWMESVTELWGSALNTKDAPAMAPYALYQAWLKTMQTLQDQMKGMPLTVADAQEAWKLWFEYATEAWLKVVEVGGDPLGLTAQWLKMMDEARARLQTISPFPLDPFTLYKQWYDATSETWAKIAENFIGTEQFIQAARHFSDSYASYTLAMRRANEAYFHNLQLPTRSDIARVANLVIAVEDKVDKLEDAFEDVSNQASSKQTEAVQHVRSQLRTVEKKVDALQTTVTQVDTTAIAGTLAHLDQRLTQVEDKLDQFLRLLEKMESREKVSEPRRRSTKAATDTVGSSGFIAENPSSESMKQIK
jgi:polyhydroxyalkanoic acid synthase PhaR subunit